MADEDILLIAAAVVACHLLLLLATQQRAPDLRAGRVCRGPVTRNRSEAGAFNSLVPLLEVDENGL